MSEIKTYTLELKESQFQYLSRMAQKHDLPDEGKALRCLVNYALEQNESVEKDIFEEIRCLDC
jgi:hypothetical protein